MLKYFFLALIGLGLAVYFSENLTTAHKKALEVKDTATDTYNTASEKAKQLKEDADKTQDKIKKAYNDLSK